MSIDDTEAVVSIVQGVVTIVAIAAGGIWAWYRFIRSHEHEWNLDLQIRHVASPYSDDSRLCTLYIDMKNIGKVPIHPGTRGCEVSVVQIPRDRKPDNVVRWRDGQTVVDKFDVIGNRGDEDRAPFYTVEPGCLYTEVLNVVLPCPNIFLVQARFWWKDNEDRITTHEVFAVS